jgi:hypothetical protein
MSGKLKQILYFVSEQFHISVTNFNSLILKRTSRERFEDQDKIEAQDRVQCRFSALVIDLRVP